MKTILSVLFVLVSSVPLSSYSKKKVHCKKGYRFPIPSQDVKYQTLPGRESLIIHRPSLVSDFLAGNGKIANLFYSVL